MKDKELRKLIGSRAKQRRLELNLTQPYVAEKMGVTASTILRYENGSIDNTKKMVLEGLSEALHVSICIRTIMRTTGWPSSTCRTNCAARCTMNTATIKQSRRPKPIGRRSRGSGGLRPAAGCGKARRPVCWFRKPPAEPVEISRKKAFASGIGRSGALT